MPERKKYVYPHQHQVMKRQIACYPRPKYFAMFMADKALKSYGGADIGKSEFLNDILEAYYRALPEAKQQSLIEHYNKMVAHK